MIEHYKVVYKGGTAELTEKKSKFIALIQPVKTEGEAIAFINTLKKANWNANHNCSAYVIGARNELQRCSDDGEPQGTAGKSMLDVLLGEELHDVCAVVTRYFGGTRLGTGGLVRAYSKAVQEGLKQSIILEKQLAKKLLISTDYNNSGKIEYLLGQAHRTILYSRYTDKVEFDILVPIGESSSVKAEMIEKTNGNVQIEEIEEVYYGKLNKEIIFFE